MVDIQPGLLLIADPFLKDPNFMRTVVLICEHQEEGSIGFILNRMYDQYIGELLSDLENIQFPVYYGGPAQKDTIHFIHRVPHLIYGGTEVTEGVFWGGDFEMVIQQMKKQALTEKDIRFYLGYSGWGQGQLQEELTDKSWISSVADAEIIFNTEKDEIWKTALKELGGVYEQMVHYPIDPQLN